ncbi:hypothetical protein BOX15_Mlig007850g1 [Macrostomum lignano]|uniref:UPAR/Ly6 domain-containing protein n=2 Tax=Macrostomum lignano TaxID=282301 RepID=A0A1I8I212_9PLAT|nr:hypothetical protein BOX15_Mlig007850g3 [Macrostomum lignano]PAA80117.1 hypothetical protein BOX15_Mlig007850g2 [Macrostomum lignano]PAA80133.1 hypothetical protein BOX15_Mlig007850g1 [Macrostomum lignano]
MRTASFACCLVAIALVGTVIAQSSTRKCYQYGPSTTMSNGMSTSCPPGYNYCVKFTAMTNSSSSPLYGKLCAPDHTYCGNLTVTYRLMTCRVCATDNCNSDSSMPSGAATVRLSWMVAALPLLLIGWSMARR